MTDQTVQAVDLEAIAVDMRTTILVEALNALKAEPTAAMLQIGRQLLMQWGLPATPADAIDAGLLVEMRNTYITALDAVIKSGNASAGHFREALALQRALGGIGSIPSSTAYMGSSFAPQLLGHSSGAAGASLADIETSRLPFLNGSENPEYWDRGVTKVDAVPSEPASAQGHPQMPECDESLPFA